MKLMTIFLMMSLLSACHNTRSCDAFCASYIPLKAQSKDKAKKIVKIDRQFMEDADDNNETYKVICK